MEYKTIFAVTFIQFYCLSDFIIRGALTEIKIGVIHSGDSTVVSSTSALGAVEKAFKDVNNNTNLLNGVDFKYILGDGDCTSHDGIGAAVDLYNQGIKGYIGPPCSASCLSAGLLSTSKKIPMISYSCSSLDLSKKDVYPFFARTKPFSRTSKHWTPKAFTALMNHFNWHHVCTIERNNPIYTPLAEELIKGFKSQNITIGRREIYISEDIDFPMMKNILEKLKDHCRIICIISRSTDVTKFLVHAYHMGLLDGRYAFITIDFIIINSVKNPPPEWNIPGRNSTEKYDFMRHKVIDGLIYISVRLPDKENEKYLNFTKDVRNRLALPPFNMNITDTSLIKSSSAFLYDAVMIMATAMDTILKADPHNNLTNATQIYESILNTTIEEFTGPVLLDKNGDRIPKFYIRNMHGMENLKLTEIDPMKEISILRNVTFYFPGGQDTPPLSVPVCGFDGSKCPVGKKSSTNFIYMYLAAPFVLVFLGIAVVAHFYNKKRYEMNILCKGLIINMNEISFGGENSSFKSKVSRMSSASVRTGSISRVSSHVMNTHHYRSGTGPKTAIYKSKKVFIKTINQCKVDMTKEILLKLKKLKDINHTNVNPFVGVMTQGSDLHTLWHVCSKGSLQDVLQNEDIECDWTFRLSFVSDIAKGLYEIHKIGIHGNLSSSCCLVDNRWVCKISNYGITNFKYKMKSQSEDTCKVNRRNFWRAPEFLRQPNLAFTKEGDIYSYGIIMYEISSREDPYSVDMEKHNLEPGDVLNLVTKESEFPYRPSILTNNGAPEEFNTLMTKCWKENPEDRITMKELIQTVGKLNRHYGMKGSLVDHMLTMMEKYTNNLEDLVLERTKQLEEEKLKTETLLYKMLPVSVANKLKNGEPVLAEHFSAVTIFFSDIVGFTALCSESTPIQVVEMLNDLYSCFDNIIDSHDVYKVETIGDAYMVVSGLPLRNGNKHAGEIATMSLDLLSSVRTFKVRHKPNHQLQLRIGIHTGSCVAGVVGLKMPRYCLFGDTVNYASRMESSGLALRIHVSPECSTFLNDLGGYNLEERGPVEMKGKGTIVTHFLIGKEGYTKELPDLSKAAKLSDHTFK